jgi:beta-carotene hydroxylase
MTGGSNRGGARERARVRPRVPKPDRCLTERPSATLGNPTLLLFLAATGGGAAATAAALAGQLALPVAATINGLSLYVLYTVTHEAVHTTAHPHAAVNRWLGRVAAALEGMTFPLFRIIHLHHHAFTNDPDLDPDHVIGRTPRWLLPVWLVIRLTHDNSFAIRQRLWAHKRRALAEHLLTVGLQFGTVAGLSAAGYGQALLVLWLVPLVVAGVILHVTVAFVPHYPHASRHPLEDTRLFPGTLWHVLTLGQNYHLVHHLWTNIPWYRYSAAAELAARVVRDHHANTATPKQCE